MTKIGVFTGNRAEYGLLHPIIKAIHEHPKLTLQLFAGGDHVVQNTLSEIEADGFPVAHVLPESAEPAFSHSQRMCETTAAVTRQLQPLLEKEPPDFFLVLGDRFETFAAALAAFYQQIPLVHLGGGDVTGGGCVDDALRFMLSEIAAFHFVFSEDSRNRLLHRGFPSGRVILTASPVMDNILNTVLIPKEVLLKEICLPTNHPIVLFTQHPIPAEGPQTVEYFKQSLEAMAGLSVEVIATSPNLDGFGADLRNVIGDSKNNHPNIHWVTSLGRQKYLSWLAVCDVVAGNSSSGLIETPFFQKASVTIGPRQSGRIRGENVLEVPYGLASVRQGMLTALNDPGFKERVRRSENPFGTEPCAPKVCEVLSSTEINPSPLEGEISSRSPIRAYRWDSPRVRCHEGADEGYKKKKLEWKKS